MDNVADNKLPKHLQIESAVGVALILASKSNYHKYLFAHDFDWLIIPAVMFKQFYIFRDENNHPIAFITWAKLTEESEERILSGMKKLRPGDWRSGENIWIIDIIADPNLHEKILHQMHEHHFKGKDVYIPRADENGKLEKVKLAEMLEESGT